VFENVNYVGILLGWKKGNLLKVTIIEINTVNVTNVIVFIPLDFQNYLNIFAFVIIQNKHS
jgi:hypothetical protein